jgi:hypothetical protein
MGFSLQDAQTFRQALTEQMQQSEPTIRISSANLAKVLADGEFKSGVQTNSTGAPVSANGRTVANYLEMRNNIENKLLSVNQFSDPSQRPVYGYMESKNSTDAVTPSDITSGKVSALNTLLGVVSGGYTVESLTDQIKNSYRPDMKEMYQNILAKYNDAAANPQNYVIANQSYKDYGKTVTSYGLLTNKEATAMVEEAQKIVADGRGYSSQAKEVFRDAQRTLNNQIYPLASTDVKINADLLSIISQKHNSDTAHYGDAQVTLNRNVLGGATVTNGDSIDNWFAQPLPAKMADTGNPRLGGVGYMKYGNKNGIAGPYLELQMYQHPTTNDISRVLFTGKTPAPKLLKQLDALGIPYTVDAPKQSLGKMGAAGEKWLAAFMASSEPKVKTKTVTEAITKLRSIAKNDRI